MPRRLTQRSDGLLDDERLSILERSVLGDVGLEQQVELLRRRIEELESYRRRRELGWVWRLFEKCGAKLEWENDA